MRTGGGRRQPPGAPGLMSQALAAVLALVQQDPVPLHTLQGRELAACLPLLTGK